MERKATITITTTHGTSKGSVLVRDDGTLGDQIQDCDADLGDVYDEIELAISGETLGRDAVEGDGEGYSFSVEPLPPEVDLPVPE